MVVPYDLCDIEPIILIPANYSLFISVATSSFIIHYLSFFAPDLRVVSR